MHLLKEFLVLLVHVFELRPCLTPLARVRTPTRALMMSHALLKVLHDPLIGAWLQKPLFPKTPLNPKGMKSIIHHIALAELKLTVQTNLPPLLSDASEPSLEIVVAHIPIENISRFFKKSKHKENKEVKGPSSNKNEANHSKDCDDDPKGKQTKDKGPSSQRKDKRPRENDSHNSRLSKRGHFNPKNSDNDVEKNKWLQCEEKRNEAIEKLKSVEDEKSLIEGLVRSELEQQMVDWDYEIANLKCLWFDLNRLDPFKDENLEEPLFDDDGEVEKDEFSYLLEE
ncbi:hypothetical protein Pfo_018336 [Paulownia fortunei]|nr:hypothetical protein Pfo_018336 [Paulownia fortunei]